LRANIAITGLTAAGKTTHALLLSSALGYDYSSASEVLLGKVGMSPGNNDRWVNDMAQIERRRADGSADRFVDDQLLASASECEGTVFDSWFLPYLYRSEQPLVSIYLDSDLESRAMKCLVSQLPSASAMTLDQCRELIQDKDDTTIARAQELYGIDLQDTTGIQRLDNTGLIREPTIESARHGIGRFHTYLLGVVHNRLRQIGSDLNPHPLVELAGGIVQNNSGHILLIHRNREGTLHWEIPGGKVEVGESGRVAARRELLEETGVESTIGVELGTQNFAERGIGYRYTWFEATITSGTPTVVEGDTFDDMAFFSRSRLDQARRDGELSPNAVNFYDELIAGRVSLAAEVQP
jgi:ADP-ribose pyrophosphatase YjhB (NUDIX family)/cytidylate kinase